MKHSFSKISVFIIFLFCFTVNIHAQTRNGIVITKDEKGVIREKGKMEKGRREGKWEFYNAEGKLEQEVNYLGGKKYGAEIHYWMGDTISYAEYKNDIPSGEWKKWGNDLKLISLEHYNEDGEPTGSNFYWDDAGNLKRYSFIAADRNETRYEYDHGKIKKISHARNDRLDGKVIIYNTTISSPADSIAEIHEYKDGKLNGDALAYTNGKLRTKISFCDDKPCDTSFVYNENGAIERSTPFQNGMENGTERSWENGKLSSETNFKNGAKNGKETLYTPTGSIKNENWYSFGRMDSANVYFLNNAHSLKSHTSSGLSYSYHVTTWYETGNLKSKYDYYSISGNDIILQGLYTIYFTNGKPKELFTYKSNLIEGKYKRWNEEGILLLEGHCEKNELKDSVKAWNNKGEIIPAGTIEFDKTVVSYLEAGMGYKSSINTPVPPGSFPTETDYYYKADTADTFEECRLYTFAEIMPAFPNDGFQRYLQKNIKYPTLEKEANIQGTVYVSFIVTRKGTITDVKCIKDVSSGLSKEAIRVIKSMPQWTPGKVNGKPVNVRMVQPIKFVLQ
jgi:TonB family protein